MRIGKIVLSTLTVVIVTIVAAASWGWFSNWGGSYLLDIIQTNLRGKISATSISGNLIRGVTYENLLITGPDGREFMRADQALFRLSLWSIPTLHMDIANFGLINSNIQLVKMESGRWNYSDILKPAGEEAPPTPKGKEPPAPGTMAKIKKFIFRQVNFDNVWTQNGKITVTDVGLVSLYSHIELKTNFIIYDWGESNQSIDVKYTNLGVTTPQGRAELETALTYKPGLAKIEFLNVKLANKTILSLKGDVCKPLQDLTCNVSGKVGPVSGALVHQFWSQWPAPWDLTGKFSFSSTPDGANVESQGKIGQADFAIKGKLNAKVKPAVFNLDADLKNLNTAQLQEIQGVTDKQVEGLSSINAHLHVEGKGLPSNPISLSGNLNLSPFRYRDLLVEKVHVDLSGNAERQKLKAEVAGNFGTVDLSGDGHLLPLGKDASAHGDLTLQTSNLKPGMLGITSLAGTNLTSSFIGNFRLPPGLSTARLYLAGDLTASGTVKNEPVQSLQARFVLEGKRLTIADSNIQAAGIIATVRGTFTPTDMDISYTATTSGSRALPMPSGASFSYLQVQGTAQGPFKNPQINLSGRARSVAFDGTTLQSANLTASLSGLPPQSGRIDFRGTQLHTKAGDFAQVNLLANGAGGQWQFKATGTSLSNNQPKFELAGTADLKRRPLTFDIDRVSWQSQNLKLKNQTRFQVRFSPGYEISPATFMVDGGTVSLQLLARGGELSGKMQIKDLNAALLEPLGLPATGRINGNATLTGSPAVPVITAQLSLSGGQVKDFPIQTLTTKLNYQADKMQVAGYMQAGPQNSRLVWNGVVPVSLSLIPFKFALADRGLNIKVSSENVNLSMLTLFTKEVERADSKVDAEVLAQGNPRNPNITGHVRWTAGNLLLRQAGTCYTLEAGEITLQGDKITVPGIVLVSQGTARFSGTITLAGGGRGQAVAQLNDFLALNRGGNDLTASGTVNLNGTLNALVARGNLTVNKADFRPTFFQSGQDPDIIVVPQKDKAKGKKTASPSTYKNMTINVTIDGPRNIWLKDPMGKVELTAHITAKKQPAQELALGGEIHSLHGTLDVEGNEFTVERAIITLPGAPNKPILVDARATHKVEDADVTIIVLVNGTVSNPQIHLESEPPLPKTDVLSYMVFGAPAATLTREQYLTFAAQYGILGGAGGNKIGDILGSTIPFLRGIKVKTGMAGGRPSVGVEKKVTKNVSLFVTRHLDEERGTYQNQAGVQYKINKHLSAETQVGTRNSGGDVFFNYDF